MRSDYCYGVEMRRALERHKAGETHIIPIILRPVDWKSTPIGELQALPTEGKPVTTWRNRDLAFQDVVRGVGAVLEMICSQEEYKIGQASIPSPQGEDANPASNLENAEKTGHAPNSTYQQDTPLTFNSQQPNIISSASSSSLGMPIHNSMSRRSVVHIRRPSLRQAILSFILVLLIILSGLGFLSVFLKNKNATNNVSSTATALTTNAIASQQANFRASASAIANRHLGLEAHFIRFLLTVDVNGLLTDSPQAINAVKQQVRAQPTLQNRKVGLAIVYGGAPNDSQISTALKVAQKVYAIFQALGQEGIIFTGAAYYDPLFTLGSKNNSVEVDVFLCK